MIKRNSKHHTKSKSSETAMPGKGNKITHKLIRKCLVWY